MKERIKSFYKNHQSEINTAVVSATVAYVIARRKYSGHDIATIDHWHHPDGRELIKVDQKNGEYLIFTKTQTAA